jgi:hypothetical protein
MNRLFIIIMGTAIMSYYLDARCITYLLRAFVISSADILHCTELTVKLYRQCLFSPLYSASFPPINELQEGQAYCNLFSDRHKYLTGRREFAINKNQLCDGDDTLFSSRTISKRHHSCMHTNERSPMTLPRRN